jgi:hypothetical protein
VPPRAAWFLLALFGATAAFIYHSVLPTRDHAPAIGPSEPAARRPQ